MGQNLHDMNDEQLLTLLELLWEELSEAGKLEAEEKIVDLNDSESGE